MELPKCKLCDNYPVNYHTGAFGVKHHCADKHCTLHNVLFTEKQWRTLMGEPEPNLFWDYDNGENGPARDPDNFAEIYADDNMDHGEIAEVTVECAMAYPKRKMRITAPEDEASETVWEWIE